MTHYINYNLSASTIKELTRNGMDATPELLRVLLINIIQVESQAGKYERSEDCKRHANA
jgi:hypothetical protein